MSHHKSSRELHAEHTDSRNEAALRVRALAAQEEHARARMLERLVGALVQRPQPHVFHECPVTPVSPRRGWDWPDQPGGPSSDFDGCVA